MKVRNSWKSTLLGNLNYVYRNAMASNISRKSRPESYQVFRQQKWLKNNFYMGHAVDGVSGRTVPMDLYFEVACEWANTKSWQWFPSGMLSIFCASPIELQSAGSTALLQGAMICLRTFMTRNGRAVRYTKPLIDRVRDLAADNEPITAQGRSKDWVRDWYGFPTVLFEAVSNGPYAADPKTAKDSYWVGTVTPFAE